MPEESPTFRLSVLGQLRKGNRVQPLTLLAEFQERRAVAQVKILSRTLKDLATRITNLRGFIEANYPELEPDGLERLGGELFRLLIRGKVKTLLDQATGGGLEYRPFELFVEDYEVAGWPWEYMYNAERTHFLCQSFYPISRGIFTLNPGDSERARLDKVRLLLVLATPPQDPEAKPGLEAEWIRGVFQTHLANDAIQMDVLNLVSPQDFLKHLENHRYHLLHFYGHGGFDLQERKGYLKFTYASGAGFQTSNVPADLFAEAVQGNGIRLVFLNACETAKGDRTEPPARSSVAGALLDHGIPAVIANQFSMPAVSASYLSSMIYTSLAAGKSLAHSVRKGRQQLRIVPEKRFVDWGIPVLYASRPNLVLFTATAPRAWASGFDRTFPADSDAPPGLNTLLQKPLPAGGPAVATEPAPPAKARVLVGFQDIDAKVAFLPELVRRANAAQNYYAFQVFYLPVPSGIIQAEGEGAELETSLAHLEEYLSDKFPALGMNQLICLTGRPIIEKDENGRSWDFFSSPLEGNRNVCVLTTVWLRGLARKAGIPLAKAVLHGALSQMLLWDERWGLEYHAETAGCLFDYCERTEDALVGLQRMAFVHPPCRNKVRDEQQLQAIDVLLALKLPEDGGRAAPSAPAPRAGKKGPDTKGPAAMRTTVAWEQLQTTKGCKEYLIEQVSMHDSEETKQVRAVLLEFFIRSPGNRSFLHDPSFLQEFGIDADAARSLLLRGLRLFTAEYDNLHQVHDHVLDSIEQVGEQIQKYRDYMKP